jgi:hypothetical protein
MNLTHRESHERPSRLEPGWVYAVRIRLNDVAHRFAPGNRIRLALSTSYWPIAWPAPEPFTLTVHREGSYVELPLREPRASDRLLYPFAPPESGPEAKTRDLDPQLTSRAHAIDPETHAVVTTVASGFRQDGEPAMTRIEPLALELGHGSLECFRIDERDPLSASGDVRHTVVSRREGWRIRVRTKVKMRATRERFRLEAELEAFEGGEAVYRNRWVTSVPRDLA